MADHLLSITNPWLGSGLKLISRHQPLEPLLIIMLDLALAHRHQPDLVLSSKWINIFTITVVGLLTIKQLWDLCESISLSSQALATGTPS
ncbi:hypothetical protein PtB15_12B174 [Puccinia triticina]|nr:hypothetical protein PtB15_12B174 [Puccinia triticina]